MLPRKFSRVFPVVLVACSCRQAPPSADSILPAALDGGWSRVEHGDVPASEVPELVRNLGWRRSVWARYSGPVTISVRLHETASPTVAFECAQKWRHAPGTMAFHHGRHFVLVEGEPARLHAFIAALEAGLGD